MLGADSDTSNRSLRTSTSSSHSHREGSVPTATMGPGAALRSAQMNQPFTQTASRRRTVAQPRGRHHGPCPYHHGTLFVLVTCSRYGVCVFNVLRSICLSIHPESSVSLCQVGVVFSELSPLRLASIHTVEMTNVYTSYMFSTTVLLYRDVLPLSNRRHALHGSSSAVSLDTRRYSQLTTISLVRSLCSPGRCLGCRS